MYDSVFMPVKATLGFAPDSMLKYVHCNCKISRKMLVKKMDCNVFQHCRAQHCENQSVNMNLENLDNERNTFGLFWDLWDTNNDYSSFYYMFKKIYSEFT